MAIVLQQGERNLQRLVDAITELTQGRQNSIGDVTLRANQTTTTVSFQNCSKDCRVFLFPQTANAAASMATTFILRSNIVQRQFTVTHSNSAQTDRVLSFLCIGG